MQIFCVILLILWFSIHNLEKLLLGVCMLSTVNLSLQNISSQPYSVWSCSNSLIFVLLFCCCCRWVDISGQANIHFRACSQFLIFPWQILPQTCKVLVWSESTALLLFKKFCWWTASHVKYFLLPHSHSWQVSAPCIILPFLKHRKIK